MKTKCKAGITCPALTIAIFTMCLMSIFAQVAQAQKVAIKTNLLYDATTTLNGGIEFGLTPKWTLDFSANVNPWTFSDNKKWKHWLIQPEARYWFCNKMMGHFIGFHAVGGQYNIGNINGRLHFLGTDLRKLKENRYEGWMAGAGIAYGYNWPLSKHWGIEAEIGIGYLYSRYNRYECKNCGSKLESNRPHHYVGPTKAAINLIYVF